MKNTKVKTTPVVEKKENMCACGEGCTCGDHCACGCEKKKTLLKCGTMLVSAIIIAASIVMTAPDCPFAKRGPRADRHPFAGAPMNEAGLRDFIMKNPKVLIDSVDAYYKKQQGAQAKPAQAAPQATAPAELVAQIVNDKTNYSLGNPKGKFVIIEFFDYNCGWCKRTNKALSEAIKSKDGANIRWIPIDTPIFGEASEIIARYVLAAGKQGKYAEMHEAVGEAKGRVDEAALIEMGKKLKLDTKKLTADAKSKEINDKLVANREFTKTLNINGVPMLIVDGKINPGALFGEKLDAAVQASKNKK